MKTLDEVIESLDNNCTRCGGCAYVEEDYCKDRMCADALHYLKEYRACGDCSYADSYLRCTQDSRNDPLDWDELKTMVGKPVWVESHGDISEYTGWAIVSNVLEDRMSFIFSHYDGDFLTYEMSLPDCTFNSGWQAYRKENTNGTN